MAAHHCRTPPRPIRPPVHRARAILAACVFANAAHAAPALWEEQLWDDFASSGAAWVYGGVSNAASRPLFEVDAGTQRVRAEWDQTNRLDAATDPQAIMSSSLLRPLPCALTDRDSFRVRAVLRIEAGSIPNTTEFYQIANVGLYNPATGGPDRTMNDNWSGNATLVPDAADFVEFNYFINNASSGYNPSIGAVIGAHVEGPDGDYTFGTSADAPFFHDTDMGEGYYLPTGTNLHVEIVYFGGEVAPTGRRARATVYTDNGWTNILAVNGVSLQYWTQPLPADRAFRVTHAGFQNYVGSVWSGVPGRGMGSWDDLQVEVDVGPRASWKGMHRVLAEDFSRAGSGAFSGMSNLVGRPLAERLPTRGVLACEWDQSRAYGFGDPVAITNSAWYVPLPTLLTDADTFRAGATLRLEPGSIPNTTEFYQLANFGLYNPAMGGADRTMSDNWSGNGVLVADGSDFVEFSYFINNASFGFNPSISAVIAAHTDGPDGDYFTGTAGDAEFFHDTDMGEGHYLPAGTNLYVELAYYGRETDATARRASCAVYTDCGRTNLLHVNGVPLYYWTQPLPADRSFMLTHAGFITYAAENWGGENGRGKGQWDALFVDVKGATFQAPVPQPAGGGVALRWDSVSGRVYRVECSTNLAAGAWFPAASVVAGGVEAAYTGTLYEAATFYRVVE